MTTKFRIKRKKPLPLKSCLSLGEKSHIDTSVSLYTSIVYLSFVQEGYCKTKGLKIGARIHSYRRVKRYNEEALKKALAYHGPATISINANPKALKFYSHGVLDDITCSKYTFLSYKFSSLFENLSSLSGTRKTRTLLTLCTRLTAQ